MKKIPLTKGKFAIVDDEDYEWLSERKWHIGGSGYAVRFSKRKCCLMHREIMKTPRGMDVDHINGNTLDNRKENLRNCTRSQNNMNRNAYRKTLSGFKGVYWDKEKHLWYSRITYSGTDFRLGYFRDPVDAALAYDDAARKHYGEFAHTNF